MSLRKHKYKQRLEEILQAVKEAYAEAATHIDEDNHFVEMKDILQLSSQMHYWIGYQALAKKLLEQLTLDEATQRKMRDERRVLCIECMWTGMFKDAFLAESQTLVCPRCAGEAIIVFGTEPKDKTA